MTGFNSKRDAAADKDALFEKFEVAQPAQEPVAWVGLTLDEIEELFQIAAGADEETDIRFARLIEAKLKRRTHE